MESLREKQKFLHKGLRNKGVEFKWHQVEMSSLEAVFARGDRRLAKVILKAWEKGCRFDAWREHFRFPLWSQAFQESGIDPRFYANRVRHEDEIFPWDHLDTGVDKEYLISESKKARNVELTPDCRQKCNRCGVCKKF